MAHFKDIIRKSLEIELPDFIFNPHESNNKLFCFTRTDDRYIYDIIFQISNFSPEFTVEMVITKKKKDGTKSINLHKSQRLGRILYQKDYWWIYSPDDETKTKENIEIAVSALSKIYQNYFEHEKSILEEEYIKLIDKYKIQYPQVNDLDI